MRTAVGFVLLAGGLTLRAEVPRIDGIFPAGGPRGTVCEVTVSGQFEPWPLQVTCDDPGLSFSPDEKEKGKFLVRLDEAAETGAHGVRFFNAEGATEPRFFVVGSLPERFQTGPERMEVSDLPVTVNGKLEAAGDVDRFRIGLEAGQCLVAEVAAYALDSPLDPLLHLVGPSGQRLAFNHDATRSGLDPRLVFTATETGTYELQLSAFAYPPEANIQFAGGANAIYRLTLGHDPPVVDLSPPLEADGEEAQDIAIPAVIGGHIDPPGDVDRYRFEAKKGETLHFEVIADGIASWMDPVLVIEDAEGKELKRQDDIDSKAELGVEIDWSPPGDGNFLAKILDLNGAGGSEIAYRLEVSKPGPGLGVSVAGTAYAIKPGGKLEIAVKVERRRGFAGALEVGAGDFPPGVTASPVTVPETGDAKLIVEASAEAAPASVPFSLWAGVKGAGKDERFPCRFALKGAFADSGDLPVNDCATGWLTVLGGN